MQRKDIMPKQTLDDLNARDAAFKALAPALDAAEKKYDMAGFCARHEGLRADAISHWRKRRTPSWANINLLKSALVADGFLPNCPCAQPCEEAMKKPAHELGAVSTPKLLSVDMPSLSTGQKRRISEGPVAVKKVYAQAQQQQKE